MLKTVCLTPWGWQSVENGVTKLPLLYTCSNLTIEDQ